MPIQPDRDYQTHLAAGKFMLPTDASGKAFYPPRAIVPGDGSEAVGWVEASGKGIVYSVTTLYQKPPAPNYVVALIDLAEGPRMMSNVVDIDPAEVKIGMSVRARITAPDEGAAFVVFVPEKA